MKHINILGVIILASLVFSGPASAALLDEGFDDITNLPGWVQTNNSSPLGLGWFQGNDGVFTSQAGADNSYIAANYLNTSDPNGVIDNWLISPELSLAGGAQLRFHTRTADPDFNDTLEIRFSTGSGSAVSGFASLLLTIGDITTPYPDLAWQEFTVNLPAAVSGRFAFRYTVTDAINADYIGIDTVSVTANTTPPSVPEPSAIAIFGLGLTTLALRRRYCKKP